MTLFCNKDQLPSAPLQYIKKTKKTACPPTLPRSKWKHKEKKYRLTALLRTGTDLEPVCRAQSPLGR